jgi:hypothetical protein
MDSFFVARESPIIRTRPSDFSFEAGLNLITADRIRPHGG